MTMSSADNRVKARNAGALEAVMVVMHLHAAEREWTLINACCGIVHLYRR
jgi:hypothetical protein